MEFQPTCTTTTTSTTFYEDLVAFMTNRPVQIFLEKHMRSWSDIESCLLFIKLYQNLAQYTDDPSSIISVIHRIMNTAVARREVVAFFRDFQQERRTLCNARWLPV